MAAVTFPLTADQFADLLKIESVSWNLMRAETTSHYGSGEWLTSNLAPDYWEADVSTIRMLHPQARAIQAWINSVGSSEAFELYPPDMKYPASDPTGANTGAGDGITIKTINADLKRITLQGLPASFRIYAGEFLAIDYDSGRRYLVQTIEQETADGSGDMGLFEIRPHLVESIAVDDTVFLSKPSAKMKIIPGTDRIESVSPTLSRITFRARQTLQDD